MTKKHSGRYKNKPRRPALQKKAKLKVLSPAERLEVKLEPGDGLRGPHHLTATLGGTPASWMKVVEETLRAIEKPLAVKEAKRLGLATKGHATTDPRELVKELAEHVYQSTPEMVDGNVFMAQTLGMILVAWGARIGRAKAMSPLRPLKLRRYAYERWLKYTQDLMAVVTDERADFEVWGGQAWENPFMDGAHDGTFR